MLKPTSGVACDPETTGSPAGRSLSCTSRMLAADGLLGDVPPGSRRNQSSAGFPCRERWEVELPRSALGLVQRHHSRQIGASERPIRVPGQVGQPNFFLWIDVVRQGDAPLRARPLRGRLEKLAGWFGPRRAGPRSRTSRRAARPNPPRRGLDGRIPGVPKSPQARGREGVRPLGIFEGGEAHWVQAEEWIRRALTARGSAYG